LACDFVRAVAQHSLCSFYQHFFENIMQKKKKRKKKEKKKKN